MRQQGSPVLFMNAALLVLTRSSWTEDFLRSGGYSALLTRLNEVLEVEWRLVQSHVSFEMRP